MDIIDVHVMYEPVSAIPDYNVYGTQLDQLIQQLAGLGFVTERDTRKKAIDPLFMGLGDYDVKSDGFPEGDLYHRTYHLYHYKDNNGKYKWEDAFSTYPRFSMLDFQKLYGLSYSPIPDLVIKNGSKLVIVEAKKEGQDLNVPKYKSKDVIELLNRWEKDEVDAISKFCDEYGNPHDPSKKNNMTYPDDMPDVNMPIGVSKIRVHWYDGKKNDLDPAYGDPNTDPAYNAGTEFTLTFKDGTEEVKLYEPDWYLSDLLYAKADVRSVVLTNGRLARRFYTRRFYKGNGQITSQITSKDYDLNDESQFNAFRKDVQSDLA